MIRDSNRTAALVAATLTSLLTSFMASALNVALPQIAARYIGWPLSDRVEPPIMGSAGMGVTARSAEGRRGAMHRGGRTPSAD
ncbi:MAG TPA: hypothetical protein PKO09_10720 [Anaerolineae bacterium]|nr:hypothetical protein [Anaerolineae bacterium]